MTRTCKRCEWWEERQSQLEGLCRVHAPTPFPRTDGPSYWTEGEWPRTFPDDWCGEFKQKDKEE